MQIKSILFFFVGLSCFSFLSFGQRPEFGVNLGGSGYTGDLNPDKMLKVSGLNAGGFARLNIDPHWSFGVHYNFGNIKADDSKSDNPAFRLRNINFTTNIHEVTAVGQFNFFDMYSEGSKKRLSPYLLLGLGGIIYQPYGMLPGGKKIKLADSNNPDLRAEGYMPDYTNYAVAIPYGGGVKYKKTENWTIFGQLGYRTVFGRYADYLDDVSGVYPAASAYNGGYNISDPSANINGGIPQFKPGDQRGDYRKRDTYFFVNIGISYTFVSSKCFTF